MKKSFKPKHDFRGKHNQHKKLLPREDAQTVFKRQFEQDEEERMQENRILKKYTDRAELRRQGKLKEEETLKLDGLDQTLFLQQKENLNKKEDNLLTQEIEEHLEQPKHFIEKVKQQLKSCQILSTEDKTLIFGLRVFLENQEKEEKNCFFQQNFLQFYQFDFKIPRAPLLVTQNKVLEQKEAAMISVIDEKVIQRMQHVLDPELIRQQEEADKKPIIEEDDDIFMDIPKDQVLFNKIKPDVSNSDPALQQQPGKSEPLFENDEDMLEFLKNEEKMMLEEEKRNITEEIEKDPEVAKRKIQQLLENDDAYYMECFQKEAPTFEQMKNRRANGIDYQEKFVFKKREKRNNIGFEIQKIQGIIEKRKLQKK